MLVVLSSYCSAAFDDFDFVYNLQAVFISNIRVCDIDLPGAFGPSDLFVDRRGLVR